MNSQQKERNPMDVADAIAATKAGRVAAFEHVVRACDAELRAFLACRCATSEAVDETTQETFVLAFEKLSSYDPERGSFVAWLKGIGRNLALQDIDRRSRESRAARAYAHVLVTQRAEERARSDAELRQALRDCLSKMSARQREILELRYRRGLRVRDLAESLGRTVTWATTTLQRARDALRKCIRLSMAGAG